MLSKPEKKKKLRVYVRHVESFGFQGAGMFADSKYHSLYYRSFPSKKVVVGISNHACREGIFRFDLSAANMKAFSAGKLSLTPPGCCHATGGRALSRYTWVHQGPLRDAKHLKEVLTSTGLF